MCHRASVSLCLLESGPTCRCPAIPQCLSTYMSLCLRACSVIVCLCNHIPLCLCNHMPLCLHTSIHTMPLCLCSLWASITLYLPASVLQFHCVSALQCPWPCMPLFASVDPCLRASAPLFHHNGISLWLLTNDILNLFPCASKSQCFYVHQLLFASSLTRQSPIVSAGLQDFNLFLLLLLTLRTLPSLMQSREISSDNTDQGWRKPQINLERKLFSGEKTFEVPLTIRMLTSCIGPPW